MISVQEWITRLNVDRDKFQNDTFGGFIDQNFTFSAPMPYSEQLSWIQNEETFRLNAQMKKVMNPEYEWREVQNFMNGQRCGTNLRKWEGGATLTGGWTQQTHRLAYG